MGVEEPQSEGPEESHRTPVHHPNQRVFFVVCFESDH